MTKLSNSQCVILAMLFSLLGVNGYGQNSLNSGDFTGGSWGSGQSLSASVSGTLILTKTVPSSGDKYFRFYGDGSPCGEYQPPSNGDYFTSETTQTVGSGCGSSNAWRINVPNTTDYVIFKTDGLNTGGNAVVFVVTGAPITVSAVTNPGACPGVASTITATLSGNLPSGQAVYLRYSNDNFVTTAVTKLTGSGTSYSGIIPASYNTAGATVKYYVFTSGTSNVTTNGSNADFYTINLNNNSGSNYSYNVSPAVPTIPGAISGTTPQCPSLASQVYSVTAVSGASTYTWTVPTGWTITAGATTNSITVTTGNTGQNGNITVTAGNSCGTSSPQTLAVTIIDTPATITTPSTGSIATTSAILGGNVTTIGCSNITERGIYYSTTDGFADGSGTKVSETGTFSSGTFTQNVASLVAATTYYYKAFAVNSGGTVYTTQDTFTTDTTPSVAATTTATAITSNSATSGGNITSDGGDTITERGVVYNTSSNPTTANTKIIAAGTTGSFTSNLSGLIPLTTYYVRAYATNSVGTTYGTEISFTTATPIYSAKAYFSLNGGSTYFTGCNVNNTCDPGGNGAYDLLNNVVDVGSLAQGQNFNIGGNIIQSETVFTNATMHFRVYKSGNTAPAYSSIALTNSGAPGNGCNSGDIKWEKYSSFTTIVAGLNSAGTVEGTGTYIAEIYYTGVSSGITYTWYKTGTTPFSATFAVTQDIFSAKVAFKIDSNTTTWNSANHDNTCDPGNDGNFHNKDFGVVVRTGSTALAIGGNIIANTAVTNSYLRYRFYSTSIADPSGITYQTVALSSTGSTSCSGKTKKEQNTPQTIAPSSFATDGDYYIEAYFEATDATGVVYYNNSNSNFKARISIYLPTPVGERDANDGNYDPTVTNSSGIYESYMGVLVEDENGAPISGLNRVFDMDGALSSSNGTNFDFGTQNPGLSFNVGTETKIFTKGTHKDCGCSSWYYVYKSTDANPVATDFPLPTSGSLFSNQINGKFTLLNSSESLGINAPFTRTTSALIENSTSTTTYNNSLGPIGANTIKYKDYTDPVTGTVNSINNPVTAVGCPTCSGTYKVAIAMLAWVSTTGDCSNTSSLIYHRDINKNKINDTGVVLNPNHPNVPTSNAGSPSKNTLPGTDLFYISTVTIGASNGTKTWNGSWSPSGNPTSKNNVVISANYSTASGSITCNDMTVNDGIVVTIINGTFIEALNTVDTKSTGKIIIENTGNFVQRCNEKPASAKIEHTKTTRAMSSEDYVYWGTPVLENVISQFPAAFDYKYKWVSGGGVGSGWVGLTETKPAEGFITRVQTAGANSVTFSGTASNGILTTPIARENATQDNYNNFALLANPYPCAIDAQTFLLNPNNTTIESTLYFWTSITPMTNVNYTGSDPYALNYNPEDYATWNFTGGTGTGAKATTAAAGVLIPTGKIASGQGFFVEAKNIGSATVTFDNNMRLKEDVNTQFFKIAPKTPKTASNKTTSLKLEEGRIWLNISNPGHFRQTLLGYMNGATNGYDGRFDGTSYSDSPILLYTRLDNKDLVIQGRQLPFDENEIVPLGYEAAIVGDFYINIDQVDGFFKTQNVFLKDNLLGIEHDLKQSAYLFSTTVGKFDNRFELKYVSKTLGVNSLEQKPDEVVVSNPKKQLKINSSSENISSITVYDITGKTLLSKTNINNTEIILDKLTKQNTILLLKVKLSNNKEFSKKVVF